MILRDSLSVAATLCAMALFPAALYALVSSRVPISGKLGAAASYTVLAALGGLGELDPFVYPVSHAVGFGYVTLCALLVWALGARIERPSPARSAGLFLGLCGLLIAVPGALLPAPASFVAVAWGFELVFKSYSYLQDGRVQNERPALEAALFQLLIDPVLCFPERSRQVGVVGLSWAGLLRCALGMLALFAHAALIAALFSPLAARLQLADDSAPWSAPGLFVLHYVARFVAGYARHSGGASLAIGAMRLLGFRTPERYHYPWLATSPADFWRRWNTYLGSWARRYVFVPAAGRLQRKLRGRVGAAPIAKSAAVIATFVLIGVLHDFGVFAQYGRWPLGGVLVFGLNAAALLIWSGLGEGMRSALEGTRPAARGRMAAAGPALSRVFFLPFLAATVWIAIPTMSTDFAVSLDTVWRAIAQSGAAW